ncbi:putative beta-glucanosyltransferase gel3 [Diaporthe eres]|uniref:1,3-beta-glucanosyltransferase n=1 Tax=Diaporthe vaccinii TaxID=105482 RepID=A0ABR4EL28_9PEZI|nr:putative beta-glucanosyltransferase gel3 [Diaporthe eres]
MFSSLTKTAIVATLLGNAAAVIDPIVAKGQYFFYSSNGTQFFIKGVAYQQGIGPGGTAEGGAATFIDSLADTASCARDIPFLQQLGTNTIRVYAIDPTADHQVCMNALADAGIYVIADLSVPGESVERDNPSWNTDLFARYQGVIDNLGQYPNTIGFFAGNEVTNNKTNTAASAFIKAAVRDSKAYIQSKNFGRWLGVGYATNDDAETRDNLANYFNCGQDQASAVDFWGYNIYEWCGQSTFQASGYEERTQAFANYSVPAFFSEYGCNNPGGGAARVWQETGVLYSDQMNKVWSGGIVYEYFQEQNDFGLVDQSGTTVTPRKDFQALATAIKNTAADTANPSISMNSYTASNVPRACPAVTAGLWEAAEALPPTPNATLCENMVASSSCVPTEATTGDAEKIGSLFGTVCGMDAKACAGITSDAANGTYGAFVMCNPVQQLTHALNEYYANQKKASTACDFAGQAKVVSPTEAAITPSSGSTTGSSSSGSSSSSGGSGSVSGTSASPSSPSTSANSTAPASASSSSSLSGGSSQQGGSAAGGSSASQNGTASSSGAGGKSSGGDTTAEKGGSYSDSASSAVSSSAAPASATASSSAEGSSAGPSDASSSDASSDAVSDTSPNAADASTANPTSVVSSASESASQGSNSATVIQGSSDAGRTSVVGNTGLLLAAVAVIASTLL